MPPYRTLGELDYSPAGMARGVRRTHCGVCRKSIEEVGKLSTRGKCQGCADERMVENAAQLHAHSGPFFEHWLRRTRAAFGLVEVDADRDAA